jgi:hypothetical protein
VGRKIVTMVIDAFMWSYERDAVKIHIANLAGVVDAHIAVQATNTFRGKPRTVKKLDLPNVIDVIVTIPKGLDAWGSEKWLRDAVLTEAIKLYGPSEWYLISDGDEIPRPEAVTAAVSSKQPTALQTDYRNFYADWRGTGEQLAHQPTIGRVGHYLNVGGANDARWYGDWVKSTIVGWHLSSLGGDALIKEKLETFAHTEYDTPEWKAQLASSREGMRDFLDRFDLEYTTDIPKAVPKRLLGGKR